MREAADSCWLWMLQAGIPCGLLIPAGSCWGRRWLWMRWSTSVRATAGCKCSDLRGSEQPAAFQEGIETSSPPGAKEGCQGHLAVGALP